MAVNHITTENNFLSLKYTKTPTPKYKGKCIYNDALFRFAATKQKGINPFWRGTVSAINNEGFVVNAKCLSVDGDKSFKKASLPFKVYSDDEADIKDAVSLAISRLFFKYTSAIEAKGSIAYRPDLITPITAFNQFAEAFIVENYKKASAATQQQYLSRLKYTIKKLPHVPMCEVTEAYFENMPKKTKKTLHLSMLKKFWKYCIENGYCNGENPIPKQPRAKTKKRKNDPKGNIKIEHLLPEQESTLYDYMESNLTPPLVGVAIMLGSSFSPKKIVSLKWCDVEINSPFFVTIKDYKPEYTGATKNYTRPLAPRSAYIVYMHYQILASRYTKKQLEKMYLITPVNKPLSQYNEGALVKTATNLLRQDVISYDQYKLISNQDLDFAAAKKVLGATFAHNLKSRCNLEDDPGSLDFLLGKSLKKDVTSDSYRSFTSPAGLRHLNDLMSILNKEQVLRSDGNIYSNPANGFLKVYPETTHSMLTLSFKIELPPGATFNINCKHGVYGRLQVHKNKSL